MNRMRNRLAVGLALCLGLMAFQARAGHASADVVVEWNQLLQTHMPSTAGLLAPRYYAVMHVAVFDAVNSIERQYSPYRARVYAHPIASTEAAAAQAAHDVLSALIPTATAQAAFAERLQARLAGLQPERALFGVRVGKRVASEILAWRANDGSAAPPPAPWSQPAFPGLWQPTSASAAQLSNFGLFAPFALLTSTQYLPAPPPPLNSERYATDFEEVRLLGSATSTVRTAEQTQTARLFASVGYSTNHWAMWNNVARDTARAANWSLLDTARLFALVNVSAIDGLQTSHASKFVYGLWRPVTAIRRADEDLNPATIADATWTPLLSTPAYPSHGSNMACVGTSISRALARAFATDAVPFSVTWVGAAGNPDVTRNYPAFSALAVEQARSRVYGGIHFDFELEASRQSCTRVADYIADRFMRPRG
jgi:hypothetical protein